MKTHLIHNALATMFFLGLWAPPCSGQTLHIDAEKAASMALEASNLTVAAAASIEFIRPVLLDDELRALAREDYRGSKRGLYTVEIRNQHDEIVALFHGRSASRGERLL